MTHRPVAPHEHSLRLRVDDESDLPVVTVRLTMFLRSWEVTEPECARLATVAQELATNIVKYARCGQVEVRWFGQGLRRAVEIEAVDRGPGIADIGRALTDRFSTSGTLGLGLPGVKRLVDEFHIESTPGEGTLVRARRWLP
jgi:serine/threonine-protein kinase RsbT